METRIPINTVLDTHFSDDLSLETEYSSSYSGLSWSSIFAGLLTVLATLLCLSFLLIALGFGQIDLYSSAPFGTSLLSVGLGSLIILFLSLASGGFLAGHFAKQAGAVHGFLTWALFMLVLVIQTILFVSGAAQISAQTISGVASATKDTLSNLGTEGNKILSMIDRKNLNTLLHDKNDTLIDFNKLSNDLRTVLNKSQIPALDPDHLYQEYREALKDIRSAITAFKKDPSHYNTLAKQLGDQLSQRIQNLTKQVDRHDVIQSLMNNGMTQTEAEKTADRAIQIYQTASAKAEKTIKAFNQQLATLANTFDKATENTRSIADTAIGTTSTIGWWSFFASLIGALIASLSGYYGYKTRQNSWMF